MKFSRRVIAQSLAIIVMGVLISLTTSANSAYANLSEERAAQGVCGDCHTSTLLGQSSHDFHGYCSYSDGYKALPSDTCHQDDEPGTCDEYHNECEWSEEFTVESVAQLVRDGSLSQLSYLISKYADKLTFNGDRRAIQVLDCDGHVAAHLPVSADIADALTLSN